MNHRTLQNDKLIAGMIVSQPVLSDSGTILLEQGTMLTNEIIRNLRSWNVASVNVVMPKRPGKPVLEEVYTETLSIISQTFEKVKLFREVPVDECKDLVSNYIEITVNIPGVVENLHQVKEHSEYIYRHSLNVAIIAGLLGKWLGLEGQALQDLMLAGLLHDVGKAFIPKDILDKPGELTEDEQGILRMHSMHGYQLVANSEDISPDVKLAILQHHERNDGSGYPLGLQYQQINEFGKIIAIANLYATLISEQPSRRKLPPFAAMEAMLDEMYGKLDPKICLTLVSSLSQHFVGSVVELSDGSIARVILLNDAFISRPIVQLADGTTIDLEQRRDLTIVAMRPDKQ